jgi:polyisoprenoid-binding protein YceI
MKKINLLIVALVVSMTSFGQSTWSLDKAHGKLGFSITHMLVSDVEGFFKSFDIKVTSSQADFSDAVINLTGDVKSINTDNEQRDTHLKGADFFDVEKYPSLTFKSKQLKKEEGKKYKLTGELTIHGVTKPVELDVTLNGTTVNPNNKKTIAGFKVTGTIKRSDFTIGTKFPNAMLSDEVAITANIELIKD